MEVSTNHKERGETMEKASKKINELEIEFNDGTKKRLSQIPLGKVAGLKLDGKKDAKTGKFTSFTCKKAVVSDDGKTYVERRILQNADMVEGVCYDLSIPLVEAEFNKISFQTRLDEFVSGYRVSNDSIQCGKGGGKPKDPNNIVDALEAALIAKGMSPETVKAVIESNRKALLAAGFGK